MTRYAIICGANYGDEGKGQLTDYLAEKLDAKYVARFNGGAQAGHTVHRNGKRHVFSSFGAASFQGRQTIFTPNVVFNPYAALKEAEMLRAHGLDPAPLLISRNSPVTTQFDMVANQLVEKFRGARHGSCGLGINETITRHLNALTESIPGTLFDMDDGMINTIAMLYPERLDALLGDKIPEEEWKVARANIPIYVKEFKEVMARARRENLFSFAQPKVDKAIIYEGAQGLALDENLGEFPHVTRSNTGIANALDHINTMGGTKVIGVYVTRTFLTKHGAGKLKDEMSGQQLLGRDFVDETNVFNEWQENFRLAPLNIPQTAARIRADIARNTSRIRDYGLSFVPTIAVTFMNEKEVFAIQDEAKGIEKMRTQDIVNQLEQQAGVIVGWVSKGRSAADIEMNKTLRSIL